MLSKVSLVLSVAMLATLARATETPVRTDSNDSQEPGEAELIGMAELDQTFDLTAAKDSGMKLCPTEDAKCSLGQNGNDEQSKPDVLKEQPAPWIEPKNQMDLLRLLETGFKWHYEKQYDEINKYLVEKLPDSLNVAQNLDAANTLLEEEIKRGVWPFRNRALVEALEQLLQLTTLNLDEVRCSRRAYAILWKNNQAVRGRAQKPKSEMGLARRIETIINRASQFHSVACFNEYPQRFFELRKQMDPKKLQLVETFMDNYLESRTCTKLCAGVVKRPKIERVAYELIDNFSLHDPNRKYLYMALNEITGKLEVNKEGIRGLVERYIIEPCRVYMWHFGPDVFIPARFGARALEQEDRYDNEHVEFLHSWLHYRLCESLVRRDKDKNSLVKNLASYISNKK